MSSADRRQPAKRKRPPCRFTILKSVIESVRQEADIAGLSPSRWAELALQRAAAASRRAREGVDCPPAPMVGGGD